MKYNGKKQGKAGNFEGQNLPMIARITDYILAKYDIRYNEILDDFEIREKEKQNSYEILNINNLLYELLMLNYKVDERKLLIILKSNVIRKYNPIINYFESLGSWQPESKDGGITCENDYIGKLCSYITCEDPDFETQFRKHLVRCVACSLGVAFNKHCFTLVSYNQNIGKSTFIRNLVPPDLSKYYSETFNPDKKDTIISLSQNFIINIDELANLSKHDIDAVKKIISTDTIKIRRVYGRKDENLKRIANFFATTNKDEFLTDETGSVRWLCFEVKAIDFNYSKEVDINDVWKQAYNLFLQGYDYRLSPDELKANEIRNQKHTKSTVEQELVTKHFIWDKQEDEYNFKTATDILLILQNKYPNIRLSLQNIGKALRLICPRKSFRRNRGESVKGYFVTEI